MSVVSGPQKSIFASIKPKANLVNTEATYQRRRHFPITWMNTFTNRTKDFYIHSQVIRDLITEDSKHVHFQDIPRE